MNNRLLSVSFGGGTNSPAMLCGLLTRGIKPDLILFADTKGEQEHTYEHVDVMSAKCQEWWGLPIQVVRKLYQGQFEGLEQECIRGHKLPALAYGRKACSQKYKSQPQDTALKAAMRAGGFTEATKVIGIDFGEKRRIKEYPPQALTKKLTAFTWLPLVEWQWDRARCVAEIKLHGLPQPGKSSCFFCPAMKRPEIIKLGQERPDLLKRALKMEEQSVSRTPRGLGGQNRWWRELIKARGEEADLHDWIDQHASDPVPCGCFDG